MKATKVVLGVIAGGIAVGVFFSVPLLKIMLGSNAVPEGDTIRGRPNQAWKDGVYVGRAVNQRGETDILEVAIRDGKFCHIKVLSTQDEALVFDQVVHQVTQTMLAKNSADIDAVAGATISSKGIIDAVKNALDQAGGQAERETDK
jgi:uncharacterized protein with FMN-binding domain